MKELALSATTQNQQQADGAYSFIAEYNQALSYAIPRIDALNQFRIKRALSANNPQFQHVFLLLPLLIHTNCPASPVYVPNAPEGIANFELSDYQARYLQTLNSPCESPTNTASPAFDALYSMGSIGSITQTSLSDLDLWLCYSDNLNALEYQLMEQKLKKISKWAQDFGVEINFYLMNPTHFKAHLYNSDVTGEHSGSAQHYFLLDEFYRSSIRLSGKRLLWQHLEDAIYQKCVNAQAFNPQQWIDFGDFSSLSTAEFFGASLWQLYKGIQCPYKSVIKILLLESYAETYPQTTLISKEFKRKILSQQPIQYHFDPYLAMLEQVSEYLIVRKELLRLDRLRMCFYIKASEGEKPLDWRNEVLQSLVQEWHWDTDELKMLNSCPNWKIKQAVEHQRIIVEQLLQSYRNLIHFARRFHLDPTIISSDTDLLMRKLYSVFEVLPGKISLINKNIAKDLNEKDVTFIEAREGSTLHAGWYLINQAPKTYGSAMRYVFHDKNLIKTIAWSYFNGIITSDTHIHLSGRSLTLNKLRQFITDLRFSFPVQAPEISERDLLHPNEIRSLIVAINLESDPTESIKDLRKTVQQSDLFSFGTDQRSLVGSVSIIYRNMWNEIRTQHFSGNGAILKALKLISNKIYRGSAPPQSVNVFCYSQKLNRELRDFIADLVHKCISIQTGSISPKTGFNPLKVAGQTWQFIFGKRVAFQQLPEQAVNFEENFAKSYIYARKAPYSSVSFPKEIDEFASEGFLQFFFEDNQDQSFNVYILDEKNTLESYYACTGSKEEKVKEINRLHTDSNQNQKNIESFNFPQFYQLIELDEETKIVPFQSKQHRDYLAQCV